MPEITYPNQPGTDDSWDLCVLGGEFLPGAIRVRVKLGNELDVQKPKGAKGATIRDEGANPSEVSIQCQISEQAEMDQLARCMPFLRTSKKNRDPLVIEHPHPNMWGIDKVIISEIESEDPDPVEGMTVTISCKEWFPAPSEVKQTTSKTAEQKAKDEAAAWAPFVDKELGPGSGGSVSDNTIPEIVITPS